MASLQKKRIKSIIDYTAVYRYRQKGRKKCLQRGFAVSGKDAAGSICTALPAGHGDSIFL